MYAIADTRYDAICATYLLRESANDDVIRRAKWSRDPWRQQSRRRQRLLELSCGYAITRKYRQKATLPMNRISCHIVITTCIDNS